MPENKKKSFSTNNCGGVRCIHFGYAFDKTQ